MLEAFSYWVREFDVAGFRVDVAWGVRERKPEFWPRWRREMKRIKPDVLLLAESSTRDPYYFDNGYDAAYDWTSAVGEWAWELAWDSKSLITYNLHSALTNNDQGFHPDALIFRFLNNNDTGDRFITQHGEEILRCRDRSRRLGSREHSPICLRATRSPRQEPRHLRLRCQRGA